MTNQIESVSESEPTVSQIKLGFKLDTKPKPPHTQREEQPHGFYFERILLLSSVLVRTTSLLLFL